MNNVVQVFNDRWANDEHIEEFRKLVKSAFWDICDVESNLIAESLAKSFGIHLNNQSKLKDLEDCEIKMIIKGDLMTIFRCIKSLDLFASVYGEVLSARLLRGYVLSSIIISNSSFNSQ